MKSNNPQQSKPQATNANPKPPENKDNLDSRKKDEQRFTVDDGSLSRRPNRKDGNRHRSKL